RVVDSQGNLLSTDNSNETISIGNNPGGSSVSGTTTVAAVNGIATFTDLSLNKSGFGYSLIATDGNLTGVVSNPFSVTSAPATHLGFGQAISTAVAGQSIPAVTVQVLDAFNNVVTSDTSTITLSIGTNPASGTLSGTVTLTAVNGVAVFNGLSIDKAG